jgi:hypothetical protein
MIGAGQSGGYVGCPCDLVVLDSDDTVIDIDDVVTPRVRAAVNTVDRSSAHPEALAGRRRRSGS